MPDAPDWFNYRLESHEHVLQDIAELAVRLGSPVSYNRAGSVSWIDDFRCGLSKWSTNASGAGTSVKLRASDSNTGPFCADLTTGAVVLAEALMERRTAPPRIGTFGLTTSLAALQGSPSLHILVRRILNDVAYYGEIEIAVSTWVISVFPGGGGDIPVLSVGSMASLYPIYHYLKLILDFDTGKYVRLLFDTDNIDLSAHDLVTVAYPGPDSYQLWFDLLGGPAAVGEVLVDSVIFTYDEIL